MADRVHSPVSSPVTSAFPKFPVGRLNHKIPLNDFRAGSITRLQSFARLMFRPPSLLPPRSFPPLAFTLDARAAAAFTSEQNAVRYLPAHRIC